MFSKAFFTIALASTLIYCASGALATAQAGVDNIRNVYTMAGQLDASDAKSEAYVFNAAGQLVKSAQYKMGNVPTL
jgi:hypothetical protein